MYSNIHSCGIVGFHPTNVICSDFRPPIVIIVLNTVMHLTCSGDTMPNCLWRGPQVGTATTVPIICVGGHASAVALVGCGGPGELQARPPRLLMSPWPSSRLFIRSVHSGFNFRRPCQHALILEVGPTTVRPTNQNKNTGSTRVLLRLVCRVELAPGGLAWSRTLAPLLQNKTEISLFHSWLIFFRF